MENFSHVTVDKLNLECVKNVIPKGYKNLRMDDAVEGDQPPDTYILVSVLEIYKKVKVKEDCCRKRVISQEVLADGGDGMKIVLSLYKSICDGLDLLFKNGKGFQRQWLIICNSSIALYVGPEPNNYHRLYIRASHGDKDSRVWFLTERSDSVVCSRTSDSVVSIKTSVPKTCYTSLKNCKLGNKYNVFAVVTEIVKKPTLTRNGNLHMLIGIADPSSPYEKGGIKDTLLQIFSKTFHEACDFLNIIDVGQVIRIRDLKMEFFLDELRAKIYSEHQLILFPGGTDDDVIPQAKISSYNLNSEDIGLVKSLRKWSAEQRKEFQIKKKEVDDGSNVATPACSLARNPAEINTTIKDIDRQMTLQLWCEISRIYSVHSPAESIFILEVRDGTSTSLYFKKYDFANATIELLTQSETFSQPGAETVDIFVDGKVNMPKDLEQGDIVCLKCVLCTRIFSSSENPSLSLFELTMVDGSTIMKPTNHHNETTVVKEMIRKHQGLLSSGSTQKTLHEEIDTSLKRPPKPHTLRSPNRVNTQPISTPHAMSNSYQTKQEAQSRTSRIGSPHIHSTLPCSKSGSPRCVSPRLPSQTDSLEIAMRNISDFSDKRQRDGELSPLQKANSPLQSKLSLQSARRRILSGNLTEDFDGIGSSDLPSSAHLPPYQGLSEANRLCHTSVQDADMVGAGQYIFSSTPAFSKQNVRKPSYVNMDQETSYPINSPIGDESELDAMALTHLSEIKDVDASSSSKIHSETVIECSEPTASTETSVTKDSEEVRNAQKVVNLEAGEEFKELNSTKRKLPTCTQNEEDRSTNHANQNELLPSTSKHTEEPKSVKRKRQTIARNDVLLTTECRQDVTYLSVHDLLSKGKEGMLYLVPGIVKQVFTSSDHSCNRDECLDGDICYHNWVWGMCEDCGNCYDSDELRNKFLAEDLACCRLPCAECCQESSPCGSTFTMRNQDFLEASPAKKRLRSSTIAKSGSPKASKGKNSHARSGRSEDSKKLKAKSSSIDTNNSKPSTSKEDPKNYEGKIVPFFHLAVWLRDPEDNSDVLLLLSGDHAKQFFGIEPTFLWLTEKADSTVLQLVHLLIEQETTLWYGVSKFVNSDNYIQYQLAHTSLKMIQRYQGT